MKEVTHGAAGERPELDDVECAETGQSENETPNAGECRQAERDSAGERPASIDWLARTIEARDKAGHCAWDRATELLDSAAGDMPQPWRNAAIALLAEHHPTWVIFDVLASLRCVAHSIRDDAPNHKNMMRRSIETLEKLPNQPEEHSDADQHLADRLQREVNALRKVADAAAGLCFHAKNVDMAYASVRSTHVRALRELLAALPDMDDGAEGQRI